jgi:hypothetical protein
MGKIASTCSITGECLYEDLHTTTQAEHQVKGGLLLDVVVGEGAAVLELLASEDQALLIRGNSFLVLHKKCTPRFSSTNTQEKENDFDGNKPKKYERTKGSQSLWSARALQTGLEIEASTGR